MFRKDGELIYEDNRESGAYGDVILVNGVPWPNMRVERRKYRFRILNASVSRSYGFRLSTGDPFVVVGCDGGLMPAPQAVKSFRHGMAERYEVVIDFSKYKIGQKIQLLNDSPQNNIDEDTVKNVMQFEVVKDPVIVDGKVPYNDVPAQLNDNPDVMGLKASDAKVTRNFKFERKNGHWTVNGETWEDVILSDYAHTVANPGVGDVEIWELENPSGGWFHPVHIHLIDFKILDRNGKPPLPYELGPKDTAYVGENETVRVLARFGPHEGRYMIHCHNLVHEDHDMMVQFQVGENRADNDPRLADPCKDMPDPDFEDEVLEEQREQADEAAEEARRAAEEAAEEAAEAAEMAARADADALQQAQEAGVLEGTTPATTP